MIFSVIFAGTAGQVINPPCLNDILQKSWRGFFMEIGARSAPRKIFRGILPKFAKSLSKSSQNRENPHKISRKERRRLFFFAKTISGFQKKAAPQAIFHKNGLWFSKKSAPQANFSQKRTLIFKRNLRRRRISYKNGLWFSKKVAPQADFSQKRTLIKKSCAAGKMKIPMTIKIK